MLPAGSPTLRVNPNDLLNHFKNANYEQNKENLMTQTKVFTYSDIVKKAHVKVFLLSSAGLFQHTSYDANNFGQFV